MAGKNVYTRNAKYVGKIEDTIVDTEKGSIYGFAVNMARESFLYKTLSSSEQGVKKSIMIPYREIIACDDIILVTVPKQYEKAQALEPGEEEEVILPGIMEEE